MKMRLAIFLVLVSGCASRQFTVTLFRSGGASSITERYSVNQDGVGTKAVSVPLGTMVHSDSESKQWTHAIDPKLAMQVRGLINDSLEALSKIGLHDSSETTSGIRIDMEESHKEITWANVDPPKMFSPAFDSLYEIMLRVETNMMFP
jgi:hypothetical protein